MGTAACALWNDVVCPIERSQLCMLGIMRTSLKKTMSKQWENNERSLVEGVYTPVCVGLYGHTVRGHFSIGTIGPRESVLCSQLSSDVIRVQSL